MEIIGRLTANATVKTVKDERQVVNFDIAMNDSYKTRDGEKKKVTTYVQCAYWLTPKIAEQLTKGSIVSLFGRIGINAYTNMNGDAKASLTFHVNNIKFISKYRGDEAQEQNGYATAAVPAPETKDDLPF